MKLYLGPANSIFNSWCEIYRLASLWKTSRTHCIPKVIENSRLRLVSLNRILPLLQQLDESCIQDTPLERLCVKSWSGIGTADSRLYTRRRLMEMYANFKKLFTKSLPTKSIKVCNFTDHRNFLCKILLLSSACMHLCKIVLLSSTCMHPCKILLLSSTCMHLCKILRLSSACMQDVRLFNNFWLKLHGDFQSDVGYFISRHRWRPKLDLLSC